MTRGLRDLPKVSVVIVTFEREPYLLDLLSVLVKQAYPDFEIVVVEQSPEESSNVKAFLETHPGPPSIQYLHHPGPNLPVGRNVGVQAARGEIVLFIDDDAVPLDELWIRNHVSNYQDPNVIGVTGRVIDRRFPEVVSSRRTLRLKRWGQVTLGTNAIERTEVDFLFGCNMSVRRQPLLQAGLFSLKILGSAEYEDTEMSLRLKRHSGGLFLFDPLPVVYHKAAPRGGCNSRAIPSLLWHFWRFHNLTIVFLENPDRFSPLLFFGTRLGAALRIGAQLRNPKAVLYLMYAVYLAFVTHRKGYLPPEYLQKLWGEL